MLDQVGIPNPASRLSSFPHQLSGGINQCVMIAMVISCNPRLLIADKLTTALDVTIQAQILDLLLRLQSERGMTLILIIHDMAVVAETADRVTVMYTGHIMEEQKAVNLFSNPRHTYTSTPLEDLPDHAAGRRRLPAIPSTFPGAWDCPPGCLFSPRCRFSYNACRAAVPPLLDQDGARVRCIRPLEGYMLSETPILNARDLTRYCSARQGAWRRSATVKALDGTSFDLHRGKSTLARLITMIERPATGSLIVEGKYVSAAPKVEIASLRNQVQIVL